jgi:hypothetical protein
MKRFDENSPSAALCSAAHGEEDALLPDGIE